MGVFSRVSDIISANINSALDRAEHPERMIKQMIHEMEDTLVEARSSAARLIADRKGIERRVRRIEAAEADWQAKAELAVGRGREDLARAALAERTALAKDRVAMAEELASLDEDLDRFDTDIQKLEERLRETRAKQKALLAREQTAKQRLDVKRKTDDRRVDEAMTRFEHLEKRLDRVNGEIEAQDLGQKPDLATEIEQLRVDDEIEAELAAIRQKLGEQNPGNR